MPPSLALATFSAFFNGHRSTPASIRLSFPHNSHYVGKHARKQRVKKLVIIYPPKNRHTKAHPPGFCKKNSDGGCCCHACLSKVSKMFTELYRIFSSKVLTKTVFWCIILSCIVMYTHCFQPCIHIMRIMWIFYFPAKQTSLQGQAPFVQSAVCARCL